MDKRGIALKILYYNWVQFDDAENRGGGVTVYQRNIIDYLKDNQDIYFLSSGITYSMKKGIYIQRTKNTFGTKVKSFEIVNSPILSPAFNSFNLVDKYLEDETILGIMVEFCQEHGPFDVIHFNNIEGLSQNVLKIKDYFPNTKIVLSIHNYYIFCPQVNLWKNESRCCLDNDNGRDCADCVHGCAPERFVKRCGILAYYLKRIGVKPRGYIWETSFRELPILFAKINRLSRKKRKKEEVWTEMISSKVSEKYNHFCSGNIKLVNENVDLVLAVSNRVREIAIKRGINSEKIKTSYIGTKFADIQVRKCVADPYRKCLKVIYMGYARNDKGFFFLLEALQKVPADYAKYIDLFFAVKTDDAGIRNRMKFLGKRYNSVSFKNGYSHKELKILLDDMNLGIVPVLWEDNLPQVAIELVSSGVPILTSDRGGAQELGNNKDFVYKATDKDDLVDHLTRIMNDRNLLEKFWANSMKMVTIKEHSEELLNYYLSD